MIKIFRFHLAISILLVALFCGSATAGNGADNKSALRDLEMACLKNQSEPRVKRWSGSCFCVSNTFLRDFDRVPRATALREIRWIQQVFDETLSREQFELDSHNLVETLDDTLNQCAKPKL